MSHLKIEIPALCWSWKLIPEYYHDHQLGLVYINAVYSRVRKCIPFLRVLCEIKMGWFSLTNRVNKSAWK